jgi:hypothetical protein
MAWLGYGAKKLRSRLRSDCSSSPVPMRKTCAPLSIVFPSIRPQFPSPFSCTCPRHIAVHPKALVGDVRTTKSPGRLLRETALYRPSVNRAVLLHGRFFSGFAPLCALSYTSLLSIVLFSLYLFLHPSLPLSPSIHTTRWITS